MVFLEFEKPLEKLYDQLEKLRQVGVDSDIDVTDKVKVIEEKIKQKTKEVFSGLTGWQKVQLSRHPNRPYTMH